MHFAIRIQRGKISELRKTVGLQQCIPPVTNNETVFNQDSEIYFGFQGILPMTNNKCYEYFTSKHIRRTILYSCDGFSVCLSIYFTVTILFPLN